MDVKWSSYREPKYFVYDGVISWSFTFSWIKFDNVDEFLWVNISYEWVVTVIGCVQWC